MFAYQHVKQTDLLYKSTTGVTLHILLDMSEIVNKLILIRINNQLDCSVKYYIKTGIVFVQSSFLSLKVKVYLKIKMLFKHLLFIFNTRAVVNILIPIIKRGIKNIL